MNRGKMMEMICFNKKVTSREAESMGLVTRSFPRSDFERETGSLLQSYAQLPEGSINAAKKLVRCTVQTSPRLRSSSSDGSRMSA